MAELKDSSLWMKLGTLFMVLAYGLDLYSMDTPGWSSLVFTCNNNGKCSRGWYNGVEACEVIGYLCALTAVMLILCLTFLDEVKSNKIAKICFIIFSIVAGFMMIVGSAIYGAKTKNSGEYAICMNVLAGMLSITSGIFAIIELVKGGK